MVTLNLVLGIIASTLSILSIIFSRKVSKRNKVIEKYLSQNFNYEVDISTDNSKKEVLTNKKAISGQKGTSIIGDGNKIDGGKH